MWGLYIITIIFALVYVPNLVRTLWAKIFGKTRVAQEERIPYGEEIPYGECPKFHKLITVVKDSTLLELQEFLRKEENRGICDVFNRELKGVPPIYFMIIRNFPLDKLKVIANASSMDTLNNIQPGGTVLHQMCQHSRLYDTAEGRELLQLLIDLGIDINIRRNGLTALELAESRELYDMCKIFDPKYVQKDRPVAGKNPVTERSTEIKQGGGLSNNERPFEYYCCNSWEMGSLMKEDSKKII